MPLFYSVMVGLLVFACIFVLVPLWVFSNEGNVKAPKTALSKSLTNNAGFVSHWPVIIIMVVIFSISVGLYYQFGDSQKLAPWLKQQRLIKELGTPSEVIVRLKQHLKQHPNSARGWYLLGRLYFTQGQLNQAKQVFHKAYQLEPSNTQVLTQYAQTLFLLNHNRLSDSARELVNQALTLDPQNKPAINLLAVAAYTSGDYQQAIILWQRLQRLLPANSADQTVVQDAINKAKAKLNGD